MHPDDIQLYELATQLADAKTPPRSTACSACATRAAIGSGCARAASWCASADEPGPHLIGIAVDITEQKRLAEGTATADMRLRDAIETISEAFVLWDADNRLVLCNSKFQSLHDLPDEASQPGTPYEDISAAGSKPIVRSNCPARGRAVPGARTFEAQLEDGRWLQISERRTKDGGYVSVGTDITALKLHEEKLIESEKRLMATVADLRQSQQTLERQTEQLADLAEKYAEEKDRAEEANQAKSEIPRQYEPRAAHAAQRHHRLLRDHGIRHVRRARRRQISRILPRHPPQRADTCSTSSTTFSTCRRSRPAA